MNVSSHVLFTKMTPEDDVNEMDEPFYLASIVSTPRKISEDCIVGGNEYKSGHLVVNIKLMVSIYS